MNKIIFVLLHFYCYVFLRCGFTAVFGLRTVCVHSGVRNNAIKNAPFQKFEYAVFLANSIDPFGAFSYELRNNIVAHIFIN